MQLEKRDLGRGYWAKQVGRLTRSGLSAREFSAKHGLKLRTLQWWRWRLKQDLKDAPVRRRVKRARFIEVTPQLAVAPAAGRVRICLGALSMEFETPPPAAYVLQLAREVTPC